MVSGLAPCAYGAKPDTIPFGHRKRAQHELPLRLGVRHGALNGRGEHGAGLGQVRRALQSERGEEFQRPLGRAGNERCQVLQSARMAQDLTPFLPIGAVSRPALARWLLRGQRQNPA